MRAPLAHPLNPLLVSTTVTIVVNMAIVGKGSVWWPEDVGNHY